MNISIYLLVLLNVFISFIHAKNVEGGQEFFTYATDHEVFLVNSTNGAGKLIFADSTVEIWYSSFNGVKLSSTGKYVSIVGAWLDRKSEFYIKY